IDLIAHNVIPDWPRKKMLQQVEQLLLADQRTGLQELAKLVHLDGVIHLVKPLVGLLHRLFTGRIDPGLEIVAGFNVDGELAGEFEINRIQPSSRVPLGCEILHGCGRVHDFTIQLGTSLRKRAATRVFPGWYCTATTVASTSSDPSAVRTRTMSAKSSGFFE